LEKKKPGQNKTTVGLQGRREIKRREGRRRKGSGYRGRDSLQGGRAEAIRLTDRDRKVWTLGKKLRIIDEDGV